MGRKIYELRKYFSEASWKCKSMDDIVNDVFFNGDVVDPTVVEVFDTLEEAKKYVEEKHITSSADKMNSTYKYIYQAEIYTIEELEKLDEYDDSEWIEYTEILGFDKDIFYENTCEEAIDKAISESKISPNQYKLNNALDKVLEDFSLEEIEETLSSGKCTLHEKLLKAFGEKIAVRKSLEQVESIDVSPKFH